MLPASAISAKNGTGLTQLVKLLIDGHFFVFGTKFREIPAPNMGTNKTSICSLTWFKFR